ncbi:hypothetical protein [Winogradskyella sp. MIT101101]|uniref:hypothetical protein n=1 Tax=Winogradskyella sp. MIT101101 TaxID=3098297 RepID=UPI00399AE53A
MKKTINALLVDDHSSILEAYSNFLYQYEYANAKYRINVSTANCCESAIESIKFKQRLDSSGFDLALIDMRLPKSKNERYTSGEDVCVFLKKTFPKVKTIIITGHFETLVLSGILHNVNPDAMLLKGDIDSMVMFDALTKVLNDESYYSKGVLHILRKKLSSNTILEDVDKQMLYELWKGTPTKDLVKYIPLSLGAIEKRKRKLRTTVGIKGKNDALLVDLILRKGFR